MNQVDPMPLPTVTFAEANRLWFKVGCLSFGGAAAQIAMLHRFVVDERRWLDERGFLNALNFCMLLPGPEAQQLATYLGWRLHGVRGGLAAGAFFVLPGALVMLGLSLLYVLGRGSVLVDGLFVGIQAAVLAIVVEALHRIAKRALRGPVLVATALLSFLALFAFKVPFPLVITAAAVFGFLASAVRPGWLGLQDGPAPPGPAASAPGGAGLAALGALGAWWLPVAVAALTLGASHVLVDVGLFFSKLAVVTFGGAYAVLAYLADAAVNAKGWATAHEMVDGLGLAETTPGPTILVNQFVGFLAAYRLPDPFAPLVAGALGAFMATWVTFAPSFLWIFAGAPYLERIVANRRLAGALAGITAAVVGVIATLALTFGLNVLFAEIGSLAVGPVALPGPVLASLRLDRAALCALAAIALFGWHLGVMRTVGLAAAAGLALTMLRRALGL